MASVTMRGICKACGGRGVISGIDLDGPPVVKRSLV